VRNSNLRAGVIGEPLREIHVQPKELPIPGPLPPLPAPEPREVSA
jgi:hypothetical protein